MLIHDKKHFTWGASLMVGFFVVLAYMFTPSFGGQNAFHASDQMFNSISKGSTYYIPEVEEAAREFTGQTFGVSILEDHKDLIPGATTILAANGLDIQPATGHIALRGDLGLLMDAALKDADAMFKNQGDQISGKYGMEPKLATYIWWQLLSDVKIALDKQKNFKPATFIQKKVINRGIEVGYNYFGIEGRHAGDEWGKVTFALIFYVIYTLWFGYSIFFMFEGLGLQMTAGKKKEM